MRRQWMLYVRLYALYVTLYVLHGKTAAMRTFKFWSSTLHFPGWRRCQSQAVAWNSLKLWAHAARTCFWIYQNVVLSDSFCCNTLKAAPLQKWIAVLEIRCLTFWLEENPCGPNLLVDMHHFYPKGKHFLARCQHRNHPDSKLMKVAGAWPDGWWPLVSSDRDVCLIIDNCAT